MRLSQNNGEEVILLDRIITHPNNMEPEWKKKKQTRDLSSCVTGIVSIHQPFCDDA